MIHFWSRGHIKPTKNSRNINNFGEWKISNAREWLEIQTLYLSFALSQKCRSAIPLGQHEGQMTGA